MINTNFPQYDFTYKILETFFDSGSMLVEFIPTDTKLPGLTYNIPIDASFDANNIKEYLIKYAPNEKWFAQEVILQHGDVLRGLEG